MSLIDYQELGMAMFGPDLSDAEKAPGEIAWLTKEGVKAAEPYSDWRAEQAANDSKRSVKNRSNSSFERFEFFDCYYQAKPTEAERRAGEKIATRQWGRDEY